MVFLAHGKPPFLVGKYTDIFYNNKWYSFNVETDQSYENQWGLGTHTASVKVMGFDSSFEVEIVSTPIESIVCDDIIYIENTNGFYQQVGLGMGPGMGPGMSPDAGTSETYYVYNVYPRFTVTFKDGTVMENQSGGVMYNGQHYTVYTSYDQSYANRWGVGEHEVTIELMGATATCKVKIVESPIESIVVPDIEVIEGTGGRMENIYNPNTGTYESFYMYSTINYSDIVLKYKDGTEQPYHGGSVVYEGISYHMETSSDQSITNPWGIGEHTASVSFMGVKTDYKVTIIESPYVSIEVLNVETLVENEDCWYEDGMLIYRNPCFTYRVTLDDGSSFVQYYEAYGWGEGHDQSKYDFHVRVTDNQEETPWTPGGENYITVTQGDLSTQVKVEIKSSSVYQYYEEDDGIYITGCNELVETLVIPSEIDGLPVVGIMGLENALAQATEIVIPDSVKVIAEGAFETWMFMPAVEKITIGSGVTYLSKEMFCNCYWLQELVVSESNPYYSSQDGVVYDKAKQTIVVYPQSREEEYVVPASVTNIDVMYSIYYRDVPFSFAEGSTAFVEENGVIYNANKTKVVHATSELSGEYVMPNTVTEIADNAFWGCTELTSVVISNNVTEIAYGAFMNCSSLQSIDIPSGVVAIEERAFDMCFGLEQVKLPSTLKTIGEASFASCENLTEIDFPASLRTIGNDAFEISGIESIVIPDNVTYLGSDAFYHCSELVSATIGSGISNIDSYAFGECKKLQKVVLKNSAVQVGDCAFGGCSSLTDINLSNITGEIGMAAFYDVPIQSATLSEGVTAIVYEFGSNELAEIDVPTSLERIVGDPLWGTEWYESQPNGPVYLEHILYSYKGEMPKDGIVEVKEGTTVITNMAFGWNEQLKEIHLPNSLRVIGDDVFSGCEGLTELNIPAAVEKIYDNAIYDCVNLTAINVDSNNKYYTSIDGVLFNKDCTRLICCPNRSTDTYVVPSGVEVISEEAFASSNVKKIIINNGDTCFETVRGWYSAGFDSYGYWKDMTIECPENSVAYTYAKENLINVETIARPVSALSINTIPRKVEYEVGETLDATGLTLLATYVDGDVEIVTTGFSVGDLDSSTPGIKKVSVTYGGLAVQFDVVIREPRVTNIAVATMPAKTQYNVGEALDTTGLSLTVTYNNGDTKTVTSGYDVSGYDSNVSGLQHVTVSYGGCTTAFDVKVCQSGAVVISNVRSKSGQTIDVTLSFENALNVKVMSISELNYDTSKLELVSGAWNVDATLKDWDAVIPGAGAAAFTQNTLVHKDFFTFTFRIKDNLEDCETIISCEVLAKEAMGNEEVAIPLTVTSGKITITDKVLGDMDGNGVVTSDDAIYLLYHVMLGDAYPISQNADFDGNGFVTTDDAIYLLYHTTTPGQYPLEK